MADRLSDKTAIVTGAGSGIGRAMARRFSAEGASVVIIDIDASAADETRLLIERDGGSASVVTGDVSDQAWLVGEAKKIHARHESVNILVNNAGIGHVGNLEATPETVFDRLYSVNVKGVYNGMFAFIGSMVENGGGVILNTASIASKVGIENRFAYGMTKGAVLTMTLSVARDYVSKSIRCNCLCPARIHTPFVDDYLEKNYPGSEKEVYDSLSAYQPIGRMGLPEEVASLALFLCSDESAFITGSAYDIDGGVTLLR